MATHDYIISNASGAAVRADLNNALAAIVSNNSNASSPSTTYAYQWWADTTTGQLKLRNSANNAWITIFELDGTMLMEDGSAASPGLAFASDLNTGFFRSAADKINFATGGVERLEIGSSEVVFNDGSNDVDFRVESNGNTHMLFVDGGNDRVGIGTSAPEEILHIAAASETVNSRDGVMLESTSALAADTGLPLVFSADIGGGFTNYGIASIAGRKENATSTNAAGYLQFATGSSGGAISEAARIDSSGRLLVGTSSARTNFFNSTVTAPFQIEGAGTSDRGISVVSSASETGRGGMLVLAHQKSGAVGGNTILSSGDQVGLITFQGSDGSEFVPAARIAAEVDGTPGSNDMPGRLVFSTSSDGASSATERLRVNSSGNVGIGETSVQSTLHVAKNIADSDAITWANSQLSVATPIAGNSTANRATIYFAPYGSDNNYAPSAISATAGTSGASTLKFFTNASGNLTGQVQSYERLKIDSSGNTTLGYGGNSLHFQNGFNNSTSRIQNGGGSNSSNFKFLVTNSGSESEAMRIDSSGRLLMGTSTNLSSADGVQIYNSSPFLIGCKADNNPAQNAILMGMSGFSQSGTTFASAAFIRCESGGSTSSGNHPGQIKFGTTETGTSSTERMKIQKDGSFNVYGVYSATGAASANVVVDSGGQLFRSTSSAKYKIDIETVDESYSDALLNCRPVWYRSICSTDNSAHSFWGFIAEEVAEIDPRLVHWKTTEVTYDESGSAVETPCDPEPEGVAYDRFVPHLLNLIKRQQARIETLETQNASLEARLTALEAG